MRHNLRTYWLIQSNGLTSVRGGGADLPQIAALIGGVVAQEAIKIITKQYVPLNGTWTFDGMKSLSETFNF